MPGTLYIVATPIGNLEDLTFRALRILKEVDVILAEDTRVSLKLLSHYDIDTHILSYHQHSSEEKKIEILKLLLDGKNLALITDAGTPGISDPGNELIDFIFKNTPDIKIVPIPGASAITTTLSVSGFKTDKFVFIGFLPKKKRIKLFNWLKSGATSFAFYESPKRIVKSLQVLEENFGSDTHIFIARELTKMYETLYRGTIREVEEMIKEGVKGEIVVVVEGK
ncbi:MAG TPA: 16S rRNA (cytidine(1402)-2'-O)-methyltransferase [Patescibacteria group bacterium]|nr:16S rRNA (cytidine(1402)-2'-O)-methyltransferase [Patescibacteria group bacterium]